MFYEESANNNTIVFGLAQGSMGDQSFTLAVMKSYFTTHKAAFKN
jgi:hypothetical protein